MATVLMVQWYKQHSFEMGDGMSGAYHTACVTPAASLLSLFPKSLILCQVDVEGESKPRLHAVILPMPYRLIMRSSKNMVLEQSVPSYGTRVVVYKVSL